MKIRVRKRERERESWATNKQINNNRTRRKVVVEVVEEGELQRAEHGLRRHTEDGKRNTHSQFRDRLAVCCRRCSVNSRTEVNRLKTVLRVRRATAAASRQKERASK